MRIFIFGATGYIGQNLLKHFVNSNISDVKTIGRKDCDYNFELHEYDFNLRSIFEEGDMLVFLAAISSPDICAKEYDLAYEFNVTRTLNFLNRVHQIGVKIIFSSSDAVFDSANEPVTTTTIAAPISPYGKMKNEVEQFLANLENAKVIRFSYVYGHNDTYSSMLRRFLERDELLDVYEGLSRNIVALPDIMTGLEKIIFDWKNVSKRVLNFVGPEAITRAEMTRLIKAYRMKKLRYQVQEAPHSFWNGRAKSITFCDSDLDALLERAPFSLEKYLKTGGIL